MDKQRRESAVAFHEAAVAYFAKLGIRIERVMTDNGSCHRSKTFRAACNRLRLRQIFTRPYTPKTNGKAERFIQTAFAVDGGLEVDDGAEEAAFQAAPGQLGEEAALSQEHEVGVKWKTKRSCRSSQARTLGCLWAA
jgi:transposase InsO family protein